MFFLCVLRVFGVINANPFGAEFPHTTRRIQENSGVRAEVPMRIQHAHKLSSQKHICKNVAHAIPIQKKSEQPQKSIHIATADIIQQGNLQLSFPLRTQLHNNTPEQQIRPNKTKQNTLPRHALQLSSRIQRARATTNQSTK